MDVYGVLLRLLQDQLANIREAWDIGGWGGWGGV